MSSVEFVKMVASGNDFVIVDNGDGKAEEKIGDFSRFAKVICERKQSIGADGLLILENSKNADITMRIFNPDGTEVAMCGNGSRCVAYYAAKKGISRDTLSIETKAGILKAQVDKKAAKIEMTQPRVLKNRFPLEVCGQTIEVGFVNTGVPHIVKFVDDLEAVDVKRLGKGIRFHKEFAPEGTNANFVKINDKHNLSIRTYERGVEDETLACGTGAVASAILTSELDYIESPAKVKMRGGEILTIHFKKIGDEYKKVFLEGEVKLVCEGRVDYV